MKLINLLISSAVVCAFTACTPKEAAKPASVPPAPAAVSPTAVAGPRAIEITAGDLPAFSIKLIEAKPGEELKITLKDIGNVPKMAMGHNFILLAKGTDLESFGQEAAMARPTDFIPPGFEMEMLAHTKLLGPGESDSITFTAPKEPGEYDYICSMPGHYLSGMRGKLVVK